MREYITYPALDHSISNNKNIIMNDKKNNHKNLESQHTTSNASPILTPSTITNGGENNLQNTIPEYPIPSYEEVGTNSTIDIMYRTIYDIEDNVYVAPTINNSVISTNSTIDIMSQVLNDIDNNFYVPPTPRNQEAVPTVSTIDIMINMLNNDE